MTQAKSLPPALCLVAAAALWGAATVLNKALLSSVPPVSLLAMQLAASTFALWLVIALRGNSWPSLSAAMPLALLGVLNPGISYTLGLFGLAYVSASMTTLLWAAEPILIAVIAAVVLREPVSRQLALVIASGLLGVVVVTDTLVGFGHSGNEAIGILLLLSAVVCCAFYSVFSRKLILSADAIVTVAIQQTAGLVWAVALLLASTRFGTALDLAVIPWHLIAASALAGLMYYALAYGLFIAALRHVPAGVAGGYFNLIPVFGIALAYAFLGERLGALQWAGATVIMISVLVIAHPLNWR